jgi:toxin ParE1/3/4
MRLLWTEPAVSDLDAIHAFIAQDNDRAADDMIRRIVARAERQLSRLPESGRPGRIANTRELVVTGTPFILAYRITDDAIHILRVLHSARRWPDAL